MSSGILQEAQRQDALSWRSMQVRRISRELQRSGGACDVRIAFGGNVVFDPLPEFVEAHLFSHGLRAASCTTGFDQVLQELTTPDSSLQRFSPDFLFLHFELDALLPGLLSARELADAQARRAVVEAVLQKVTTPARMAVASTGATVLVTNFPMPDWCSLGIADFRAECSEQALVAEINARLAGEFRSEPRVQIIDLCRLMAWHGHSRARDRRLYYVAKMPWHESFLPVLADEIARHVGAVRGRIRKCLVVDLDNTLWDGVLGEEGPDGIRVGQGDPVAEAHLDLQRRILALKRRGILLAICSKNNPAEVDELFAIRTDMPLRRDDFACIQVGWETKDQGLRRIASELNIGCDSLVFLDDNPAEVELIRTVLPEVECVLLPADPASRPTCLDRVHGFERAMLTAEDVAKTKQYQENAARASARASAGDLRDYLNSLRTRIVIAPVTQGTLARTHQLFTKTNQFNLTTRRYSLAEIERFARDPSCLLLVVRAEDRFGDLGWIAAVLLRDAYGREPEIDSFLMSCRAMGRGIETAILNHIKQVCFDRPECRVLRATLIPTARNAPVRELYPQQGFTVETRFEDGTCAYRLSREKAMPLPCDWIKVEIAAPPDRQPALGPVAHA